VCDVRQLVGWLLMQVVGDYNKLLSELHSHRDWINGVESSLAVMRKTPLAENVDSLQHQLTAVQVDYITDCMLSFTFSNV